MGPPVVTRRWSAARVKDGIASDDVRRLGDVAPTERGHIGARVVSRLHGSAKPQSVDGGFAAGQPQFNFQIPLATTGPDGARVPRTEADVLKGHEPAVAPNIKKAAKEGVVVTGRPGPRPSRSSRRSTTSTSTPRSGTTSPSPAPYFRTMVEALAAEEPTGSRSGSPVTRVTLVASTIAIRVGAHAWYSYGASSTEKRDVRTNAVQWAMISDALAAGADVYDLRGITDTSTPTTRTWG